MKTSISFILDRSGSMDDIKQATIDGFNAFIADQKVNTELGMGECNCSLFQFDNKYEVNYTDIPVQDVELLSERTFIPRNSTALTDAIAITVLDAVEKYLDTDESERPDKVIIIAQTDGDENSSQMYNPTQVHWMIEQAREAWGWEFMFLGAKSNTHKVARSYGIGEDGTVKYDASNDGMKDLFATVSAKVSTYRQ